MRTATRAISVGLCLGASVPLAAVPAFAASPISGAATTTLTSKVLASTWFWNKAVDAPAALPVTVPSTELPATVPSGFPATDLVVGAKGDPSGNPDKETYLTFDLAKFGPRSVLDSFTFSFAVDTGNLSNIQSGDVPLEACLPTRLWTDAIGSDGGNWSDKPADDCSNPALGKYDATKKVYTFDVASIMQNSVGGANLGVAIRQKDGYTTPFQLAFKGAPTITAKATFHQLAADLPMSVRTDQAVPQVSVPAPATGSSSGYLPAVPNTAPETTTQQANPAPMMGRELTPATSLAPFGGDTRLNKQFWLASALGALAVLAVGLVLGQRPKVALAATRSTRLSRVLAARGAALATATPARPRGTSHP